MCQGGYCSEQQIRAVQAAIDATGGGLTQVALPVEQVVVTAVKPSIAGADPVADAPGFFVQAGSAGLFVETLGVVPAPTVGDRVSFGVTRVAREGGTRKVKSVSSWQRLATGVPPPNASDFVALDLTLPAVRSANESALTRVVMRPASGSTFDGGSAGYGDVSFTTLPATKTLRLPAALNLTEDLRGACSVSATGPLWLTAAPGGSLSTWTSGALVGTTCPDPLFVSTTSLTSSTVDVTTSRYMAPASPAGFLVRVRGAPQTVALTGSMLVAPQRYVLSGPMQPGWEYDLVASPTAPPTDTRGRPVGPGPALAFAAGGCQSMAPLVISAVGFGTFSNGFIELHNRTSGPFSLLNVRLVVRTTSGNSSVNLPNDTVPPGGYYSVTDSVIGSGDFNWSTMNLQLAGSFVAIGPSINNTCNPGTAYDIVSFGNNQCGSTLPPLNNGEAWRRADPNGCVDTAMMASDFVRIATSTAPRGLASPTAPCICP